MIDRTVLPLLKMFLTEIVVVLVVVAMVTLFEYETISSMEQLVVQQVYLSPVLNTR